MSEDATNSPDYQRGVRAGRREFALKTLNTYDNNKEETLGMVMMMILVACQLELL